MLTEQQKKSITEMVYQILKESLFETGDYNASSSDDGGGEDKRAKRESVMKWLRSDQSNHAALAYQLYGCENGDDIEQANARSLFTKKFQGHDAEGKSYEFDDDEITRLYNMKDAFIDAMD